ncbi:cytochrome P450 [Myxococcota bacterium]|nr:cytochrome P450 [Myxococcota bacterium]
MSRRIPLSADGDRSLTSRSGVDFGRDPLPDLHAVLAPLRSQGPLARVTYDGGDAWMILRHAELSQALRDDDAFPGEQAYQRLAEPAQGRTLQCMPPRQHRRHRDLVAPWFNPSRVTELTTSLLEPLAHHRIERFAKRGEADLVSELAQPYPFTVILHLLGLPEDDQPRLREWAHGLLSHRVNPDRALAARQDFTHYLEPLVALRRAEPRDDWLSHLIAAEVDGRPLSNETIYSFVRLLFPAGADTTYLALGNLLQQIVMRPELVERLRAEPAAREKAVEESLRFAPAVAIQPRIAGHGAQIAGTEIATGEWVLFGIASANRDPNVFEAPDEFKIERRTHDSLAFGAGTHFCLGSHLARAELRVVLGAVLDRLPALRLKTNHEVTARGAIFRGPRQLPVQFDI